jgi:hypothetical protein
MQGGYSLMKEGANPGNFVLLWLLTISGDKFLQPLQALTPTLTCLDAKRHQRMSSFFLIY